MILPPAGAACVTNLVIKARDAATGRQLAARNVTAGLAVVYADLKPGATYEFSAAAANGAQGAGAPTGARAALAPALLDAKPGPPEKLRAVAVNATAVRVRAARALGAAQHAGGRRGGEGRRAVASGRGARAGVNTYKHLTVDGDLYAGAHRKPDVIAPCTF